MQYRMGRVGSRPVKSRQLTDRALSGEEFKALVAELDTQPEMVRRLVATVVHVKQSYAKRLADMVRASLLGSGRAN
jgi:hypothetical protein